MTRLWPLFLILCACISCGNDRSAGDRLEAEPDPNSPSAMVRIPLGKDGKIDESRMAEITFDSLIYDFGTATAGEAIVHDFGFTNTGQVALVVFDAKSSCGCTVPEIPKDPIGPGERGSIHVVFNTTGKLGTQNKVVTVTANTSPTETRLFIRGEVNPDSKH